MENLYNIAVVTGASSGLGRQYVINLDKENLDEIWVIARRREKLEELQNEVRTPLKVLPLDLLKQESIDRYKSELESGPEGLNIKYLINASGYGRIGRYDDIPLQDIDDMIMLNCRAAVDITQLSLPYMTKGSHIMEICSVAGFKPLQYFNVYAASKAFLLRYSRALGRELLPRKISVTAVCPYWMKETEFISRAEKTENNAGSKKYIKGFFLPAHKKSTAAVSLSDAKRGMPVSTPSIFGTAFRLFSFLPDTIFLGLWDIFRHL